MHPLVYCDQAVRWQPNSVLACLVAGANSARLWSGAHQQGSVEGPPEHSSV